MSEEKKKSSKVEGFRGLRFSKGEGGGSLKL